MGYTEYELIVEKFRVPVVVTGFEPLDILQGVYMCVKQLEEGRAEVENQYTRAVRREGTRARELVSRVFQAAPGASGAAWVRSRRVAWASPRPIVSSTPKSASAWRIRPPTSRPSARAAGSRGLIKPPDCAAFGTRCTPEHPLGATMVSNEGACAAYYRYRRLGLVETSVGAGVMGAGVASAASGAGLRAGVDVSAGLPARAGFACWRLIPSPARCVRSRSRAIPKCSSHTGAADG